jgi:hypothetical protein
VESGNVSLLLSKKPWKAEMFPYFYLRSLGKPKCFLTFILEAVESLNISLLLSKKPWKAEIFPYFYLRSCGKQKCFLTFISVFLKTMTEIASEMSQYKILNIKRNFRHRCALQKLNTSSTSTDAEQPEGSIKWDVLSLLSQTLQITRT